MLKRYLYFYLNLQLTENKGIKEKIIHKTFIWEQLIQIIEYSNHYL